MKYTILYSVLLAQEVFDFDYIEKLLDRGIKVICFLNEKEAERVISTKWKYRKHPYFRQYSNPFNLTLQIVDGVLDDVSNLVLQQLADGDGCFNVDQYRVEHAPANANLCVEAGAGTGKTTVMIDRIMFLYHTDQNFDFSKVAMITFTNKATDNMRHRLLKEMNQRYALTHDTKYLSGLESISQVSVSTIHSFFRKIIIEVGPLMGYGTNLRMRSYALEKKEILRDLLNSAYGESTGKVESKFGLTMSEIESLAASYWDKMENNGLADEEIRNLNWGVNSDATARKIQKQLTYIFSQVDEIYNDQKLVNNAISMKDIIHELGRVVYLDEAKEYITASYDYIFCDEFQDTDIVQIKTISLLSQIYDCRLFVVGDIKQSIYRFRGATDAAFQRLIDRTGEIDFTPASLVKNYRTSKDILDRLDAIFSRWNQWGYLRYEQKDRLDARNLDKGIYQQIKVTNDTRKDIIMPIVKEIMKQDESAIVTVLTRTNKELQQIRSWCEEDADIAHQIKEKGSFFTSPAVLDLCAVLEGLLYDSIPMYVWGMISTPYVTLNKECTFDDLESINGNSYHLLVKLYSLIDDNKWNKYRTDIKNRPILSVIREIIDECDPVLGYARQRVKELKEKNSNNDTIANQVTLDTRSYKANLAKLLQILQEHFGSDFCSLYDICKYLRIRIATDDSEEQAVIERQTKKGYVEGYTVHSAKGLEFDHVFIPFMTFPMVSTFRSEILISEDNSRVGWVYRKKKGDDMVEVFNENYDHMKSSESKELIRDETRLLYVAMTRAIKSLYCFTTRRWGNEGINDWSGLLVKEDDNA